MQIGICSVCGDSRELRAGMCVPHYTASWRQKMASVKCKVEGCERGVKCRMMCQTHYGRVRRRELLEKELSLKEQEKRKREIIDSIKRQERERIISLLKMSGMNEAVSVIVKN